MKWKDIKLGSLIVVKNQTATHIIGDNYHHDEQSHDYKYILILSDVKFRDAKKSRKRYFYFKAAYYDDMKEKVFIDKFRREHMRSFMKLYDNDKMKQKIEEKCFLEGL